MKVIVLIGARADTEQDLPVLVARAMVADGRARWPEGSPHASLVPVTANAETPPARRKRVRR